MAHRVSCTLWQYVMQGIHLGIILHLGLLQFGWQAAALPSHWIQWREGL